MTPEEFLKRFQGTEDARQDFFQQLKEQVQVGALVQHRYIEMMAAAYLRATNVDPREVELVQVMEGNTIRFYYQKREQNDGK